MEAERPLDKVDHQQHFSVAPSVETILLDIHVVDHFSGDGFGRSRAAPVGSSSCLLSLWAKNTLDMRCMDFDRLRMDACQSMHLCVGKKKVEGGNDALDVSDSSPALLQPMLRQSQYH